MNLSENKKKSLCIVVLLLLLSILVVPFDLTIAPERRFIVVEETGTPIAQTQVIQVWYQYSLGYRDEERLVSAGDGLVKLRRRGISTSLYDLISGALSQIFQYTIHASISSSDSVYILAFGYVPKSFFDGEGLGDTVVLKRQ